MGALKGSISVRRYTVTDPLPKDDVRQRLVRGLRAHAFLPLDPKSPQDRSVGWVSILDADDLDLRTDKVLFVASGGEQLRVSLRIDVLKPPSGAVNRELASRAAAKEAELDRPLTRSERRTLKEEIARTLRLRTLPKVRVVDVVWNLDTGRLYLWSQTVTVNEAFIDVFTKSFGLKLEIEGPGRWARRAATSPAALARLEPTPELWRGYSGLRPLSTVPEEDA